MKKKIRLVLVLVLAGMGAFFWWERPPRDPVINRVRLSVWLREMDGDESTTRIHKSDLLAADPDAIRYIAYTVRSKYPRNVGWAAWVPWWLQRRVPPKLLFQRGSLWESQFAMNALVSIYGDSEAAKSALMSLVGDSYDDLSAFSVQSLHQIGPAARPALIQILRNGRPIAKRYVINSMCSWWIFREGPMGEEEEKFVASGLLIAVHDSNDSLRALATSSLRDCIASRSDKAFYSWTIPDLQSLLSDPYLNVRTSAAAALEDLGVAPASEP